MVKRTLKYEGPLKGKIRFWLNRREIKSLYREMLCDSNSRILGGLTFDESIDETNRAYSNNDFGLYLFQNESTNCTEFAFVDCEMRDRGYVEVKV